ncbi:MAG: 3-deoxy-8-phosphooctulonate synthase [Candidatus Aminicenantales bacterium]
MLTAWREIKLSDGSVIGAGRPFLIAGPCVIESEEHALFLASEIKALTRKVGLPFIFKASFDKANRSSLTSYRGPGIERGLAVLSRIRKEIDVPVLSDIHEAWQAEPASKVLDIIQIPAFLCRQTDLLLAAARTGRPLNVKKGQFMSPEDMVHVVDKIQSTGNEQIILTERGTTFGYHDLVVDLRSIAIMKQWGFPVVVDASHSVQRPGGAGVSSAGNPEFIPVIVRGGIAAGADGLFLEVHEDPSQALSDKQNSLPLNQLRKTLVMATRLWRTMKELDYEKE